MAIRKGLVLLAAVVSAQGAFANNIHVCPTCAHRTIQSAVNDAAAGDLISIAAGRYEENITIEGKGLTLQGSTVPGRPTEVAAAGRGPVFTLGTGVAGATPESIVINSLTITGGNHTGGTGAGGGVQVRSGAYLTMDSSVITQNVATKGGGVAIDAPGSPPSTITRSQIIANSAGLGNFGGPGGGVLVGRGSTAFINSCIITGNTSTDGGGIFADVNTSLYVAESTISNNISRAAVDPQGSTGGGGGLEVAGSFSVQNSNVSSNLALGPTGGGGMYISMNAGTVHQIGGSIIARNDLRTSPSEFGEGIGAGVVANNTDPVQQILTLTSDYIVENQEFGGLWIQGVALSSGNTTVQDNIGGQICSSADGTCT